MGIGGWLTWTAAVRIIKDRHESRDEPFTLLDGNRMAAQHEIFETMPFLNQTSPKVFSNGTHEGVWMGQPDCNYCFEDNPTYALHRTDRHIINVILQGLGHDDATDEELYCNLYLTDEEKQWPHTALGLLATMADDIQGIVCIEPNSKTNYTHNRVYPLVNWQKVVDALSEENILCIQVGQGPAILENVIDYTSKTTFRQAVALIEASDAFLASESGLVHAVSHKGHSFVPISSYNTPELVCYPQNHNFIIGKHAPCGEKQYCVACNKEMFNHDPKEISDAVIRHIKAIDREEDSNQSGA